jgi:hypothetical protein
LYSVRIPPMRTSFRIYHEVFPLPISAQNVTCITGSGTISQADFVLIGVTMAYLTCFLVDLPGCEFKHYLNSEHRPTKEQIDQFLLESPSPTWSASLTGSDLWCMFDLTGIWTLITIPIRYSILLNTPIDPQTSSILSDWEHCLKGHVGNRKIVRFDAILLEDWLGDRDDSWIQCCTEIDSFLNWLHLKDPLHWSVLR